MSESATTINAKALNVELAKVSAIAAFIAELAAMRTESECDEPGDCMLGDDACSALSEVIERARELFPAQVKDAGL